MSMYWRGAKGQNNIVRRYLDKLRANVDKDVEIGFSEVLTDFIAMNVADSHFVDGESKFFSKMLRELGGKQARQKTVNH